MSTIHPALLPRNISKLPLSLQGVAHWVMSQGSWKGISSTTTLELVEITPEETLGLLPIIYAHLDPSFIPSFDRFATLIRTVKTVLSSVRSIMVSLSYLTEVLHSPRFPLAATVDLWPHLRAWMEFFSLYSDVFDTSEATTRSRVLVDLITEFAAHPPTQQAMVSTPGLRRILAAAWVSSVQMFDGDGNIGRQLNDIGSALHALHRVKDPQELSEELDGSGGSHQALCLALKRTIDLAATHPTELGAVSTVGGASLLVDHMNTATPDTIPYLPSHGFIPPLVAALGVVGPPSQNHPFGLAFPMALGTLVPLLCVGSLGSAWLVQALQAGLLNQVMSWGSRRGMMQAAHPRITEQFPWLLKNLLPQALVYYPLIVAMKQAFANVDSSPGDGEFARSGLYSHWNNLKALVDERTSLLEIWEAKGRPSFMRAKVTTNRSNFQRCSVCQTASYCSQACQRVDWMVGHREECENLLDARHEFARIGLHHRDRLFLRILLYMDYLRLRVPIALAMIRFMVENPDTPLFVDFDYRRGAVQVDVFPLSNWDGSKILLPHSQRLARASGRLIAHAIRIGCGSSTFHTIWPLCASTSQFYDGLKDIARMAGGLEDPELEPRVLQLIEGTNENGVVGVYYG
ncbi:hypothetical protein FB45DRAFT_1081833 [Roridomyces roridus]|uniref:MYND-type domain-containing protein n=1 Tax=Roridomyces roridus TaxID=1738132 RepID=A0AAD7BPQ2_9AGAR|nr:hypothetical protein FB45DRAFT_1081833 [Roridomyces roridus]